MTGSREVVIGLLLAAGFTQHAPKPRRKRDPAASDGFRALNILDSSSKPTGVVLVAWLPSGGAYKPTPRLVATASDMREQYATAASAADCATEFDGISWPHVLITPQEAATAAGEDGSR